MAEPGNWSEAGPRHITLHSSHPPPMSKRHGTGTSRPRKKKKGLSYGSVDLDLDEPSGEVEIIRVWDVAASKTTGRVSATRRSHRHVNEGVVKPILEEPIPATEDIGIAPDPERSEPPPKPATKPKEKPAKRNDSVSSTPTPSLKLMVTPFHRRG